MERKKGINSSWKFQEKLQRENNPLLTFESQVWSVCVCARSLQSCPILCDPMEYSPPGSSVHGILQAKILAWFAVPSRRELPNPDFEPMSLKSTCIDGQVLYH